MATIGELVYKITGDSKKLKSAIKDSDKSVKGLGGTFKKFASIGVAAFGTVAVAGVAALTKELINTASEAEETRNKFNVVFRDVAQEARAAADVISDAYGVSQQASEKYLSGVGDIVTGLGATSEQALEAAETITKLGIDIDSFANLAGGAEQAVSALTSLFTGEREAAKALGIVINETNLKQYAEDTGLVFKELTALEKGFLSLELATEQSQLAIGDFARSQDSFANQNRILSSTLEDLSSAIGERFLPAATDAVSITNSWLESITNVIQANNTLQNSINELEETGRVTGTIAELEERLALVREKLITQPFNIALLDQVNAINAAIEAENRRINSLKFLAEASAQGIEDEEERKRVIAETTEILNEIEAVRKANLSSEEKQIEQLQIEIDQYAALRERAKEYGAEYVDLQAIINEKVKERDELQRQLTEGIQETQDVEAEAAKASLAITDEELAYYEEYWLAREDQENSYYSRRAAAREEDLRKQQEAAEAEVELEKQKLAARDTFLSGFLALSEIGADKSIELFNLNKALASSQAAINSYQAFTTALATYPPPFGEIAAAGNLALGLAQQIKILGTKPPAFANGGIVPQPPGVSRTGDNVLSRLNPGELILNEAQQRNLVNNMGGSGGKMTIEFIPAGLFRLIQQGLDNNEIIVRN